LLSFTLREYIGHYKRTIKYEMSKIVDRVDENKSPRRSILLINI